MFDVAIVVGVRWRVVRLEELLKQHRAQEEYNKEMDKEARREQVAQQKFKQLMEQAMEKKSKRWENLKEEDTMGLSASELKHYIVARGLRHEGCFEKTDLVQWAKEAQAGVKPGNQGGGRMTTDDDDDDLGMFV